MARTIPEDSVQIQEGLYLYVYTKTILGNTYTFRELYSAEGYCFYQLSQSENYDEEGNLKPANQLQYFQYMSCAMTTVEEINADIVSVPIQDGFFILGSSTNPPVTE